MPNNPSQKKQLKLLAGLLLAFAAMTALSFKDKIDLPTEQHLQSLRKRVADRQRELQKATAEADDYRNSLLTFQKDFRALKYNPTLEREAITKIDRILDDSNVVKTRSNITASHNRGKTNLQQVNVNLEFEDISMRKLADLFETFGLKSMGNQTPLYWTRFTITPRLVRRRTTAPGIPYGRTTAAQITENRQLNVSATISTYTLFPNASDLIFADKVIFSKKDGTTSKSHSKKGGN